MYKKFNTKRKLGVSHSKEGKRSILLRVSYDGGRVDLYTGISVTPDQWDEGKEKILKGCLVNGIYHYVLNDTLDEQEKFIRDYFNNSEIRSTPVSLTDLKERFNYRYKASSKVLSDEFFFMFDKYIESNSGDNGRQWSESRKDTFERLKKKIQEFKPNIKFSDLSTSTMDLLKVHLSKSMFNDALIKHFDYFKQFIKWCKGKGCQIHEECLSYELNLDKAIKDVRYLTLEEFNTIYNLPLSGKEGLERARDMFIFQCCTALRVSDLSQLKHKHIITNDNGKLCLKMVTQKTKKPVTIPLSKIALSIYNKYKDNIYDDGLVFPVISPTNYNLHLKKLGKEAHLEGYWVDTQYRLKQAIEKKTPKQNLTTHTARRTFVVIAVNEGIDVHLIALITSHSEFKDMKPYITANMRGAETVIDAFDKATYNEEDDDDENDE